MREQRWAVAASQAIMSFKGMKGVAFGSFAAGLLVGAMTSEPQNAADLALQILKRLWG